MAMVAALATRAAAVDVTVGGVGSVNLGAGGAGSAGALNGAGSIGGLGASAGLSAAGGGWSVGVPDTPARIDAFESIGMRQDRLAAAKTTGGLEANGGNAAADHSVSTWLAAGPSVTAIRDASVESRTELLAQLQKQTDASAASMASLKKQAKAQSADSQAEFKVAAKEADARGKALKKDIKAAAKTSAEAWPDARAKLASDYEAYSQSMTRAAAAASTSTAPQAASGASSADASGSSNGSVGAGRAIESSATTNATGAASAAAGVGNQAK